MEYAACVVPAAAIRSKPSHKVEMVNQLLFGEMMRIIKEKKNWLKVQSIHDNYEGWIRNNLVAPVNEIPVNHFFVSGEVISAINTNGASMLIPIGSSLPGLHAGSG